MKKYEKPEIEITVFEGSNIWMTFSRENFENSSDVEQDNTPTVYGLQMVPNKAELSTPEPNDSQNTEQTSDTSVDSDPLDNIPGSGDQSSDPVDGNADTGATETGQESSDSAVASPAEETSTGDTTVTETPADQL